MTIEDILSREEGQTFDRKSVRIKPKDLAVTMIAFANADGGDLVVGITDGKKEIEMRRFLMTFVALHLISVHHL